MSQKDDDNSNKRDKWREILRKLYEDMGGEYEKDFSEISDEDIGKVSDQFFQEITDDSDEIFDSYISDNDLNLEINFFEEFGYVMVEEVWSSDEDEVTLKRIYPYDKEQMEVLDLEIQKEIYNSRLEILVDEEKYEEAAEVRDIINDLNKNG